MLPISDKHANAFFDKIDFSVMPKNAPNPSERQHRKDFVVRNDEKSEATYQLDPDVTQGTLCTVGCRLQKMSWQKSLYNMGIGQMCR